MRNRGDAYAISSIYDAQSLVWGEQTKLGRLFKVASFYCYLLKFLEHSKLINFYSSYKSSNCISA